MPDRTQELVAFVRAVEAASFSGAARTLGATPSAISKRIARIESRLGARLFHRSTRSLALTQEGAAYYDRVAPLLRALDEAADVVHAPAAAQGSLKITAPASLGRALMHPITGDFMPRNRGLSNRLARQAQCIVESHIEPCLAMALSIVSSLRMQATRATFLRLPAISRRS